MFFFARVLRKLELIGDILCRHFLETSISKMAAAGAFFVMVSCFS